VAADPSNLQECPCKDETSSNHTLAWVRCRKRCSFDGLSDVKPNRFALMMTTGVLPLVCGGTTLYVGSIHACVERSQLQATEFQNALLAKEVCPGGVFGSQGQLQRLRFCDEVSGSIEIVDMHETLDATVFWDIEAIAGLGVRLKVRLVSSLLAGGFRLHNTSGVTSIDGFALLSSIGSLTGAFANQSVVITGLRCGG
jgi:hypothetical protein